MQCFFESGLFFLFVSQREMAIGPLSLPPHYLHTVALSAPPRECGWFLSAGPSTHGALSSTFPFFLPVLVLCIVKWFNTLPRKGKRILSRFLQIRSSSPAHSGVTLSQTHPRLCQPHLCFHLVCLYGSLFHSRCQHGLPPFRASASFYLLQGINQSIWPFITDPSRSSPPIFGDHFSQKR